MKFTVAQLGARRHYAIPRMLHEAGLLEHFYADICAVKGWPKLLHIIPPTRRSQGVRRLLGRVPYGVPVQSITVFTNFGWKYWRRRNMAQSPSQLTATHLWAGKTFCGLIIRRGLGSATAVYTFNGAGLELLQFARARGLRTVMEQTIAPRAILRRLMAEEQQMFPVWEPPFPSDQGAETFSIRERTEWEAADLILCGSEFVSEGVIAGGGCVHRCKVVPYGVDTRFSIPERSSHNGPLRVLTVGAVGLRKGSPYVLESAQQLQGKAVFRMAGPIGVLPTAEQALRQYVDLVGSVPRSEIKEHFAWADVFLLPSLCEGSATVVYEALAAGLPVICTPNTGSVVRDGADGFIVPIRDPGAIVEKLECLANNPDLRAEMAVNARQRAGEFTLEAYRRRLLTALSELSEKVA